MEGRRISRYPRHLFPQGDSSAVLPPMMGEVPSPEYNKCFHVKKMVLALVSILNYLQMQNIINTVKDALLRVLVCSSFKTLS